MYGSQQNMHGSPQQMHGSQMQMQGQQPGMYGQQPGMYGQQPGMYGQQPMGMQQGMQPMGMQQGMQPMGMQQGMQPMGMQQGMQPMGMQPGMQPMGMQPGMQPMGMQPMGMQPQRPPQQWMPPMSFIPGCPPGMEYLTQIDSICVEQNVDLLEMVIEWEVANSYKIKNSAGMQCYYAMEDSGFEKQCFGNDRPFQMRITDNMGNLIFLVTRPFKCCKEWTCGDEVTVSLPNCETLGFIRQTPSYCGGYKWNVCDAAGAPMFKLRGPCCMCSTPCTTTDFHFYALDNKKESFAKISKEWSMKELYSPDADTFSVYFPIDLDVKMKAVFVGAVFLIDFMFYEKEKRGDGGLAEKKDGE